MSDHGQRPGHSQQGGAARGPADEAWQAGGDAGGGKSSEVGRAAVACCVLICCSPALEARRGACLMSVCLAACRSACRLMVRFVEKTSGVVVVCVAGEVR